MALGRSYAGSNTYSFTVTVSSSSTSPTIGSFTATHIRGSVPGNWNTYVQKISRVQLDIIGATPSAGSSITSYKITGGGYTWSSTTEASFTTGTLNTANANTFTATVTDSRGFTATKTLTITVAAYTAPSINAASAFRCTSTGTPSETEAYYAVKAETSYSSVNGYNTRTITVACRKVGTTTWGAETTLTNAIQKIINGGLTGTNIYEVRLQVKDTFNTVQRIVDIAISQFTMHFADGGQNVSIGKAGTRNQALEINESWDIFHGETDLLGKINNMQSQINSKPTVKIAYGGMTVGSTAAKTIDYASAGFTKGPVVIAGYYTTSETPWSTSGGSIYVYNRTLTSANVIIGGDFPTERAIGWIAVGT